MHSIYIPVFTTVGVFEGIPVLGRIDGFLVGRIVGDLLGAEVGDNVGKRDTEGRLEGNLDGTNKIWKLIYVGCGFSNNIPLVGGGT